MKTIGRILIILLAVTIVSGTTLLIVNATGIGSRPNLPGREDGFDRPEFVPGDRPEGFEGGFRPERGEREGGSRFGLNRSLMMLIPLTLIVVVFLGIERLFDTLRRRRLTKIRKE